MPDNTMSASAASGPIPTAPALLEVPVEEIRAELRKVLSSSGFVHSRRLSRFLSFIVERAIEGKADSFKEYVLGVEVFDRGPGFDPRIDPIVRVEARRLRTKLRQYYKSEGRHDTLLISFCKGSYVPAFRKRGNRPSKRSPLTSLLLSVGGYKVDLRPLIDQVLAERQVIPLLAPAESQGDSSCWEGQVAPVLHDDGSTRGVCITLKETPSWTGFRSYLDHSHATMNAAMVEIESINAELLATNQRLQETLTHIADSMNRREPPATLPGPDGTIAVLENIACALNQGLALLDQHLRFVYWNAKAEQIWGISARKAVGRALLALGPDDFPSDQLREAIRLLVAQGLSQQEVVVPNTVGEVKFRLFTAGQDGSAHPELSSAIVLLMEPIK